MKTSMKLGLALAVAVSKNTFAASLDKTEILNFKDQPHLIMIVSSNAVIASFPIKKTGKLAVEAETMSCSKAKEFGLVYSFKGKAKLEMMVDGKSALTISADALSIQEKGYDTKSGN